MTKTIRLEGQIGDEMLDKLINAYNELGDGNILSIYFCSRGGYSAYAEAMIQLINSNRVRTAIYAYGDLYSCAFELFFRANCQRFLLGHVMGMYHMSAIDVTLDERNQTSFTADDQKKKLLSGYLRDKTEQFCMNIGLSDKEMRTIRNGRDAWFQPERMNDLLIGQEKGVRDRKQFLHERLFNVINTDK